MVKLSSYENNCFLIESVEGGSLKGRYSIIVLKPNLIWKSKGTKVEIKNLYKDKKFKWDSGFNKDRHPPLLKHTANFFSRQFLR